MTVREAKNAAREITRFKDDADHEAALWMAIEEMDLEALGELLSEAPLEACD